MKYRKKPVVVEAFRLAVDQPCDWWYGAKWRLPEQTSERVSAIIETLEGDMLANQGDYIIQGVKGEVYPCKPDIFEATYEVAE